MRNPFKRKEPQSAMRMTPRLTVEEAASLLRTSPEALEAFEGAYAAAKLDEQQDPSLLFGTNSRQASAAMDHAVPEGANAVIDRIVAELLAQTTVIDCDGERCRVEAQRRLPEGATAVTLAEVGSLPEDARPQLTGTLVKKDIDEDSYPALLWLYRRWLESGDQQAYHLFRQGLDILDLDPVTYAMLGCNPNSMGHWLPALTDALRESGVEGVRIPRTRIARVPLPILQLTRTEYEALTPTTLRIVDAWATEAFSLEADGDYFVKTGTFSSKFDFRNCRVNSPKEVAELGEYLTFIQHQATQAAAPTSRPCVYGMSTTNEWVVREFVPDTECRPTIYHGLPLRCEYRVFIDANEGRVLGIHPYWDPDVMKGHFDGKRDADSVHDAVTYRAAEPELTATYETGKNHVLDAAGKLAERLRGRLEGQWSLDVMQSGDTLWLIDMALAERSAFYDQAVPRGLRNPTREDWLPRLGAAPDEG